MWKCFFWLYTGWYFYSVIAVIEVVVVFILEWLICDEVMGVGSEGAILWLNCDVTGKRSTISDILFDAINCDVLSGEGCDLAIVYDWCTGIRGRNVRVFFSRVLAGLNEDFFAIFNVEETALLDGITWVKYMSYATAGKIFGDWIILSVIDWAISKENVFFVVVLVGLFELWVNYFGCKIDVIRTRIVGFGDFERNGFGIISLAGIYYIDSLVVVNVEILEVGDDLLGICIDGFETGIVVSLKRIGSFRIFTGRCI